MKTKEQILEEWLSKDGVGINYTQEQRILLAMEEYAQQDKKKYSEEDMKIAFNANIKDWISFEEFIEQFKNK